MNVQNAATQYAGESYQEKATRKFKENPFVPIGALATCAALTMAMMKMRRGESRSFNNWLRMRVIAQGVTIAAVVGGTYSFRIQNTDETKTQLEADAARRREEKAGREKAEFEERLKAAEEMHEVEVEWKKGVQSKVAGIPVSTDVGDTNKAGSLKSKGSSGGWLGWLRSNSNDRKDSSSKAGSNVGDDSSFKKA